MENTSAELRKAKKPDHTDDRAGYMILVVNGITEVGNAFSDMTNDEIVMKRAVMR